MDLLLGVLSAVAESSDLVEAIQAGDTGAVLLEGIEAAVAANGVRKSYTKLKNSLSTSLSSSSSTASITSSITSSIQSTESTATVNWSDTSLASNIGLSSIPEKHLVKCHTSELFLIDDVVQVTCDLTYGTGEKIFTGSYGVLKGYDKKGYMIIQWMVEGIGEMSGTPSIYLKKCDQSKFFKVGDVVQALYDLRYGAEKSLVPKGSHGTLKELEVGGSWTVDWWNGTTDVSTKQEYIMICDQSKFFKVGDVIKAKFDLTWSSGEVVSAGTLGTLKVWDMNSSHWDVKWWNDAGELSVTQAQIQKCHYTEYWLPDDVFKTTCDIHYGTLGTVPKGSLCKRAHCPERFNL